MAGRDLGVLPNDVNRDPKSEVALIFLTLADGLDETAVKDWLEKTLKAAIAQFESDHHHHHGPDASAIVGFGPKFFTRFANHAANNPHHVATPPAIQGTAVDADIVLHTTYRVTSYLADLLRALWLPRGTVVNIHLERGYARADHRETFGQLDGLRNLSRTERTAHTSIDPDNLPEEPTWLKGGSYGAWIKIEQNLETWTNLSQELREQAIGRHEADGSRLDLPAGDDPKAEGPFNEAAVPPPNSHVRKAGPRGELHDQNLIFRRGAPWFEATDGSLHVGLHFISYQISLTDLDVVLNEWMLNPDFPNPGAGVDRLLDPSLVTFLMHTVYVVAPDDARFPGAGYFDPPKPDSDHRVGRIHIRKSAIDSNGQPVRAELGGIQFQMVDAETGQPIGAPALTNPAGRATLEGAKIGQTVKVHETVPDRFQPHADDTVTVDKRNVILAVQNQLKPATPGYAT